MSDPKPKKTKAVMVRVPDLLMTLAENYIGKQYASRPDFIVEAIRLYIYDISLIEERIIEALKNEDVLDAAKVEFYHERLNKLLDDDRTFYKESEKRSSEEPVGVLLSIMPGLIEEMDSMVGRTKAFKNNPEFIKMAISHLLALLLNREVISLNAKKFLPTADKKIVKEDLDKLRKKIV